MTCRLYRPPYFGSLNSVAEVASALFALVLVSVLGPLGAAYLSRYADDGGALPEACWHQQPPAAVFQQSLIARGSGGVHGLQDLVPDDDGDEPANRPPYKMDMVLCLATGTGTAGGEQQSEQPLEALTTASAAAAGAAAPERQQAGGSCLGGGEGHVASSGASGSGGCPSVVSTEAEPQPTQQQWHRFVALGEVKNAQTLMEDERTPIDLLNAWQQEDARYYTLARAVLSQVYTYMIAGGICYGFISCWFATWLVYCPPNNRRVLYLSDSFLASTAASTPPPGGAARSTAPTAYGALSYMQLRALCSASTLSQLQPLGEDPTGLGPASLTGSDGGGGGGGGGGSGQPGGEDGSSSGPDAGAISCSEDSYKPTSSDFADASSDSLPGQELRRSAAAAEPAAAAAAAAPAAAEQSATASAAVPAVAAVQRRATAPATAAASARPPSKPQRVLLRFRQEIGPGSEGKVVAGTCDGVDCVIKLLGPDRSGLAAYRREVAAYAALEGLQGRHVPELLAWGKLAWGVRFLAVRRVAGGVPLSSLPRPVPAAVAAAALGALEAAQAACPGFVHGDVRLENVQVVAGEEQEVLKPPPSAAAGGGEGGGEQGAGAQQGAASSTAAAARCVLLDFGRSRLDGGAARQQTELEQLQRLLAVAAVGLGR
ncbi:hypothetical protein HYH02_008898 [Chlamydomonas schloesseri]|uniref:Protein kinase domain-containing protein n=1 Tax=Chlamydomonas schloesseri TaxID=2026947 RepID=A0A835WCR6_9CHLO|nr:hypothetical protein HYH02_008898 [Chlamydomonas schloesseri]|eukprot:KAG2445030.1 hypothetical protein HYH02_008898 [Chlamydomonas schloesseri]